MSCQRNVIINLPSTQEKRTQNYSAFTIYNLGLCSSTQMTTILSTTNTTGSLSSSSDEKEKRRQDSMRERSSIFEISDTRVKSTVIPEREWIPPGNFPKIIKKLTKFHKIGAHLSYNASANSLSRAGKRLFESAGDSYKVLIAAAASYDQAAVATSSLGEEEKARNYMQKAVVARSVANMALRLSQMKKVTAIEFLRDAEVMSSGNKLNEILGTPQPREQ